MHGLSALFMPVMIDHALFTCYDGFPKISLELDISNTYYEFDPIVSTKTSISRLRYLLSLTSQSAVLPFLSFDRTSAPNSNNNLTTPNRPFCTTMINSVKLNLSCLFKIPPRCPRINLTVCAYFS